MVNGSGICGFMPGTHFQSSDSAFHRCTWASTMVRLADWAVASCDASATPAASEEVTNCRRDNMQILLSNLIVQTRAPQAEIAFAELTRLRSMNFWILPVDVFGIGPNTTAFGVLNPGIWARQNAMISASVA